ncbi:putative glutamate ABC transporter, permease [Nocardioides phosphati]|uniref:Glutamate ABC transporter, permease n=1 Tax=Nocardioides phosphati TaxID=1867775 RepID=A0ABQ2N5J2_9ACTN|nr:amino acid ABC transporter permease [Nocardioides phosphati]GGO84016.1 putative glutamate ABC transporter, permease [Nocardioides phosphati]
MSASVLFDSPGPRTVARHRAYSVVAAVLIVVAVAWAVKGFYDHGQFAYDKWEAFTTPSYVQALLVDGLLQTLLMAVLAIAGALVMGTVLGLGKLSDHRWVRWPAAAIVEFFRATPVLLLMIFIWYALGIKEDSSGFLAVVFALTLYNGSVLAEVLRAGINAVPKGQSEAAYAIGMRKSQVMSIVLVPQAVKIMFPAMIAQCIVALKDTALGAAVLAPGLMRVGKAIYTELHNQVPTMAVVALLYIVVNLLLLWLATWAQKKYVGEKKLQVAMVGTMDTGRGV